MSGLWRRGYVAENFQCSGASSQNQGAFTVGMDGKRKVLAFNAMLAGLVWSLEEVLGLKCLMGMVRM
jgi:hypothetical protein